MDYQTIAVEDSGGVAVITLDRAQVMNALNTQMRAEITHAVKDAGERARVVVLTGAGPGVLLGPRSRRPGRRLRHRPRAHAARRVRADAQGDPRLPGADHRRRGRGGRGGGRQPRARRRRRDRLRERLLRPGLHPHRAHPRRRRHLLAAASGGCGQGDGGGALRREGHRAAGLGLGHDLGGGARRRVLRSLARARAEALAQGPTAAYGALKRAIRGAWDNDLDAQLAVEGQLQGECGRTRDFKEGVLAFVEKRPAAFEGR